MRYFSFQHSFAFFQNKNADIYAIIQKEIRINLHFSKNFLKNLRKACRSNLRQAVLFLSQMWILSPGDKILGQHTELFFEHCREI